MRSGERLILMPVLARGRHVHPRTGGCFAEVAATLTGHQWTDHPGSIPPVLARVARGVNDRTGAENRTALAPLIPWAIFAPHPPTDLTRDIAVTAALLDLMRIEDPCDPMLDRFRQRLERQPRARHVLDRIGWRRAARQLVRAHLGRITATTSTPACDRRLRELLITAINISRNAEDLAPVSDRLDGADTGGCLLPVTTHLERVDDVLELRVEPLIDQWPDWIREPWNQRLAELGTQTATNGEDRPDPPTRRNRAVSMA
jgi:hypothetical protein